MRYSALSNLTAGEFFSHAGIFDLHCSEDHCAVRLLNSLAWVPGSLSGCLRSVFSRVYACWLADLGDVPKYCFGLLLLSVKQVNAKYFFWRLYLSGLIRPGSLILYLRFPCRRQLTMESRLKIIECSQPL